MLLSIDNIDRHLGCFQFFISSPQNDTINILSVSWYTYVSISQLAPEIEIAKL